MTDKTLEEALTRAVDKATETAGQAEEFFLAQAPALAEQILAWGLLRHGIVVGVCALILSLVVGGYALVWRAVRDAKEDDRQFARLGAGVVALMVTVPALSVGAKELIEFLKVWIAPKLYLVEYAMEVVR